MTSSMSYILLFGWENLPLLNVGGKKNQNKQQISLLTSNELHDLNIYLKQTMLDVNNKPVFSFSKTNKQKYILLQIWFRQHFFVIKFWIQHN